MDEAIVCTGRDGYVISGRVEPQQLVESPYLIHPVEEKTVCACCNNETICDCNAERLCSLT